MAYAPTTSRRRSPARAWGTPLFVALAALLLHFLRFGYDWGTSDQDELIPYLLHRLDPSLFAQDWLVQAQASEFGVRTYAVMLLQGIASILPVGFAVLMLYVLAWLLIGGGVYALAHRLTHDRLAAAASVVVALVLTPQWTLGGNELVHRMLVPSMLGWGPGLWSLVLFLRARYAWSGAMLGLATLMQALVGLHLALLLGGVLLLRLASERQRRSAGELVRFGTTYALCALPALGLIAYQQLGTSFTPPDDAPSLFYILAQFRAPHHYLFYSFPTRALIRFGLVSTLGLAAFGWLYRWQYVRHPRFAGRLLTLVTVACIVAFAFTEVKPVLFVTKLQLFKMTVLVKLLMVILICGVVSRWLPQRLRDGLDVLMDHPRRMLAAVSMLWVVVTAGTFSGVSFLEERAYPLTRRGMPIHQVETWARVHAPRDAVFAVPPTWSGFRSHAQRAIVINFKGFIFRDQHIVAWFERLTDMAPLELPDRLGGSGMHLLDEAYARLTPERLLTLADRYGFAYVVRRDEQPLSHAAFEPVFAADSWRVYRLHPRNASSE